MDDTGYLGGMPRIEELDCLIAFSHPESPEYYLAENLKTAYRSINLLQTENQNLRASLAVKILGDNIPDIQRADA